LLSVPLWHLSEQPKNKVQDNGKYNADCDAGYYGEEELKASPVHKYVAGKLSQEGNSLPEEQEQTQGGEKGSAEDQNLAYTLKIHVSHLLSILPHLQPGV
jgi:hypothetical protein